MIVISEHGGDFIGIKSRAIDDAARFDGFLGLLRAFGCITLDERDGNGIGARVQTHDARTR